jgi:hypothetical protein
MTFESSKWSENHMLVYKLITTLSTLKIRSRRWLIRAVVFGHRTRYGQNGRSARSVYRTATPPVNHLLSRLSPPSRLIFATSRLRSSAPALPRSAPPSYPVIPAAPLLRFPIDSWLLVTAVVLRPYGCLSIIAQWLGQACMMRRRGRSIAVFFL